MMMMTMMMHGRVMASRAVMRMYSLAMHLNKYDHNNITASR